MKRRTSRGSDPSVPPQGGTGRHTGRDSGRDSGRDTGRRSGRDAAAYRRLLRLLPRGFRDRYGDEMEDTFVRHVERARAEGGGWRIAAVWLRAAADALAWGARSRLGAPHTKGDLVGGLGADVRFALRSLARRPGFALAALATLALGIGANGAVFSVANGLLLRPLPYEDAHELVRIWGQDLERGFDRMDVGPADAWEWRERAGVFDDLAVVNEAAFTITGLDLPERVDALVATPNLMSLLGVPVALGRDLRPEDNEPGAPGVVLLTHETWERRFGSDPGALGRTLAFDGRPATVVGILAPGFVFMDERPELVAPLGRDPAAFERDVWSYEVVARLRDGISVAEADAALREVTLRQQEEHPGTHRGWTARVLSVRTDVLGDVAPTASLVLMLAVFSVLVMGCVNVANLLLARAGARQGEIAVRSALGAGRGRIARQLLVESVVLAGIGGVLGTGLAFWGERVIVAGLPADMPPVFRFGVDGSVVAFLVAVTAFSALAVGLLPSLRLARMPAAGLREGGGRGASAGRRLGGPLVVIQTALAVVLLAGGTLMMRSVVAMTGRDVGFETSGVLAFRITPPEHRYPAAAEVERVHEQVLERLRALPGVARAGAIQNLPLAGANWYVVFQVEGAASQGEAYARHDVIMPGYFAAMGIDLLRGRDALPLDDAAAEPVVVVNESFVERHLPGRDPLGAFLRVSDRTLRVVGVVEDHLAGGVEDPVEPGLFVVAAQFPGGVRGRTLVLRTTGDDPLALLPAVRSALREVDPELPVYGAMSMEQLMHREIGGFRLIAELMGGFGVLSLILGAVGIYGVTAHAVGQRRREIGIRLALGAGRGSLVGMVVAQGARRALLGVGLGTALAVPLGKSMSAVLVGVSATDPLSLGGTAATLFGVALLACWLPARRAAAVDPSRTLAAE